jgi:NADPH-dependent F420 reductase
MQLGFLGGTGIEGKGLALRFAATGASVIIGSRSAERARAVAQQYNAILGGAPIQGMTNPEMLAQSNIVFLTVPFDQAVSAVTAVRPYFPPALILVDVTVPVVLREGRAEHAALSSGSNSEAIALQLPGDVHLVAALKTLPAHVLAELGEELQCDEFICGDSHEAKEKVSAVLGLMPSLRLLDAGPLRSARILEQMTVLEIELNRRYKKKGARFKIVGI